MSAPDPGHLTGRRMIVTGANTGLGLASATALLRAGAEVVLAVRNLEKGAQALEKIEVAATDWPQAVSANLTQRVRVERLDLADLRSVDEFGAAEAARGPLHVLMNNAGVMLVPRRALTVDGFEMHMGTNHLGHFALTARLLPALTAAGGRVVSLSSIAARSAPRIDPGMNLIGGYAPMRAYAQSKLATLLFGLELNRRLRAAGSPVTSLVAHPGWSATELFDRNDEPGLAVALGRRATALLGSAAADAARSQIAAATDRELPGGSFVGPALVVRGRPHLARLPAGALDPIGAAWLWETSAGLTGARYDLPEPS